ncbi:MAG: hypothetical protein HKP01_07205 [Gemmatimonadetes bacterium]|nr:hypothetical protein [Gemmatimonadota bacterium]
MLREELSRFRIPGPMVDPAPFPGGPVVDPVPWDTRPVPWDWRQPRWPFPIPRPGDPAPFDIARFRVALGLDLREVAGRILGVSAARVKLADVKAIHLGDIIGIDPGTVVDPAPDDVGRWTRIDPRLVLNRPWPWPPGDPPPFDISRFKAVENIGLIEAVAKLKNVAASRVTVADLAKINVRDLLVKFAELPERWDVDPAPIDYSRYASLLRRRADVADFSVREISAMDANELQATEHRINAEITRLEALRELVHKKIEGHG